MGVIKNQSIKTSIVLGIGVILGFVLKLVVFPNYLKPDEIGLLTVLLDISNLFGAFIPLGGQSILVKYLSKYRNDKSRSDSLRSIVLILTLLGLSLFSILFFLFKNPLIDFYKENAGLLSTYFLALLPLVFFRVVYLITTAYSKGVKRTVFPLLVKEIFVRIATVLMVVIYSYSALNTDGLVAIYLGIYFVSGGLVFASIRKIGGWSFSRTVKNIEGDERKEILTYGFFSILTSVGTIMIRSIDSIMLSSVKDLESAGIYSIAFFMGVFVEIPRRAISQISRPVLAEAFHNNKMETVDDIYKKSALNQLILGSFIFLIIVNVLDSFFLIMPNGEIYAIAKNVVIIIGAAKLFDMSMGINSEVIDNSSFYRLNFVSLLLMAPLGITTNLILIPILGLSGAAWASLITISLVNIFRFAVIYFKFKILPFSINWWKSFFTLITFLLIAYFLPILENPFITIIYKSLVLGIGFLASIYLFKLSPDLTSIIQGYLKKKK